jgi:hypothetical protein
MRTMRFTFFKALFIVPLFLLIQPPLLFSSDEAPPAAVANAAEKGVRIFVKDPQAQNLHLFGLSDKEQIDKAVLGQGLQVFSIPPDRLFNQGSSQDMDVLAVSTNTWQFLIVTGGKAASLLTVDFFNDQWTPVSIGSSGLATEVAALLKTWPSSAGYRCKLIKVYQAKSDFMEIFQGEKSLGVVPFTSGRIAMGLEERDFNPSDLRDPQEILSKLRPVVKTNVQ